MVSTGTWPSLRVQIFISYLYHKPATPFPVFKFLINPQHSSSISYHHKSSANASLPLLITHGVPISQPRPHVPHGCHLACCSHSRGGVPYLPNLVAAVEIRRPWLPASARRPPRRVMSTTTTKVAIRRRSSLERRERSGPRCCQRGDMSSQLSSDTMVLHNGLATVEEDTMTMKDATS